MERNRLSAIMPTVGYEWVDPKINIESLYNSIKIDELLSKSEELSRKWILSPFCWDEVGEWILNFEVEEILIDAKIRFE